MIHMREARQAVVDMVRDSVTVFIDCTVASHSYTLIGLDNEPRQNREEYRITTIEGDEVVQVYGDTLDEVMAKITECLTRETTNKEEKHHAL